MPLLSAPPAGDESARIATLRGLQILDTLPESLYDDIVLLASQICGTPIALVSLVDSERQWFKARVGLSAQQTHRDLAFCAHAIAGPEPVFVVGDAGVDPRFKDSALVTGDPRIRFYAGAPIVMADGHSMGTVCVIDTVPRVLDAGQIAALRALARQVTALFELRQKTLASEQQARDLETLSARATDERRHSAELLELALRGGELGLWDLHVASGKFTVNERECTMLGYSQQDVANGEPEWRSLIHPEDWAPLNAAMARHLKGESAYYEAELRLRHKSAGWIWALSRAVVVERDAAGTPVRIVGTHMDISQRIANRHALLRAADLRERMGAMAHVGGWELELETGKITWTEEVYRIHEVGPETALELLANIDFYAPQARPIIRAAVDNAIRHGAAYDLELPFITASGRPRIVRAQGEALMQDGKAVRLFGAFQDITERKRTEEALALSENRLSLALSSSRLAVFDWDIAANRVHRSANLSVMRGGPAVEVICSIEDVQALVHPADLLHVRAATGSALRGEPDGYEFEHRIRRLDGSWLWIRAVGRVTERLADGRARRISGIDEDLSARKAAEQAMRDSQRRLRTIADNLPALIALIDTEERYRFLNAHIGRVFGIDTEASLGRTMREVRSEAAYAAIAPHVSTALRGEKVSFVYSDRVNGRVHHYQSNYIPDVDAEGSVRGFYAMTFDITELQNTQAQLELLARVDVLTGLPNRRQFDERIAEAMTRSRRTKQAMAVVFLDIDHFKSINDSIGHAGGDAVLCEFARRLRACVRSTDTVARLAGDEFVVLLDSIDGGSEFGRLAEKIVACIRPPFHVADQALVVTTSAGVAVFEGGRQDAAEVLSLADGALYNAKKQGRDRFVLA
jgi:diguanylate cyclase (GGDEF)-like protein/PAS domain S-box-containing protein